MPEDRPDLTELAARESHGVSVALLWRRDSDELLVSVHDSKLDESFQLTIRDGDDPLDVFHHPYAYTLDRTALRFLSELP
jgi:hypothetical protein